MHACLSWLDLTCLSLSSCFVKSTHPSGEFSPIFRYFIGGQNLVRAERAAHACLVSETDILDERAKNDLDDARRIRRTSLFVYDTEQSGAFSWYERPRRAVRCDVSHSLPHLMRFCSGKTAVVVEASDWVKP